MFLAATASPRRAAEVGEGEWEGGGGVERPPARSRTWGKRPPVRSPVTRVVVEMAGLGFRVTGLPMADGSRGEVGGGSSPVVVAVRPAEEARRGSIAGRAGLDPQLAVARGEGKTKAVVENESRVIISGGGGR